MVGDEDRLPVIIYDHSSKQRPYTNPINLSIEAKSLNTSFRLRGKE